MNNLKFLRLQRGWTQEQLAKRLNLHPVTVCRIERGWYARPPVGLEDRLKSVFGDRWTFARLMERVRDLIEDTEMTAI